MISKNFIFEFLNKEIQNATKHKEVFIKEIESKIQYKLKIKNKKVKLKGKVDRINYIDDTQQILDYKTGLLNSSEVSLNYIQEAFTPNKKTKALQLLFYAYIKHKSEKKATLQAGIISFRALSKWSQNLKINNSSILTKEVFNSFEEKLKSTINKLMNKEIPFEKTQDLENCKFCAHQKICTRIE